MAKTSDADKAKKAAEEAQKEAERKAKIRAQISEKQTKVNDLGGVVTELTKQQSSMETSIGKWTQAKKTFESVDIAKNVVVKKVFEGKAAEAVKKENTSKISTMDGKVKDAESIKSGISTQIKTINTKISSIKQDITNLQGKL